MDPFWAKKILPENLALSQITLYGFLAPRQIKKKKKLKWKTGPVLQDSSSYCQGSKNCTKPKLRLHDGNIKDERYHSLYRKLNNLLGSF